MSSQFFYAFMAFFAIMNPISNLPAYMALVADDSQKISRKIAFRSLLIAFVIITVFIFSGDFIFKVFGITIVSFRIAGGILVAVIGYHMINGNHSPSYKGMEQQAVNSDPMSIAISPLAMPLFAGPGTITTALSLANGGLQNQLITVVAFALLCVMRYQGRLYGGGLSIGHSWILKKRWSLEASIGLGYACLLYTSFQLRRYYSSGELGEYRLLLRGSPRIL